LPAILAQPDTVVVESGTAIGRDAVGARQYVDPLPVEKALVRPEAFRDEHAPALPLRDLRMEPHRATVVSEDNDVPVGDPQVFGIPAFDEFRQVDGLPVIVTSFRGTVKDRETTLKSVERRKFEDSYFVPPTGYKENRQFAIPKGTK